MYGMYLAFVVLVRHRDILKTLNESCNVVVIYVCQPCMLYSIAASDSFIPLTAMFVVFIVSYFIFLFYGVEQLGAIITLDPRMKSILPTAFYFLINMTYFFILHEPISLVCSCTCEFFCSKIFQSVTSLNFIFVSSKTVTLELSAVCSVHESFTPMYLRVLCLHRPSDTANIF